MIGETVYVVHTNYTFGDSYIDIFSTRDKAVDFMWKTLDDDVYDTLDDVTKNDYEQAKAASDSYYSDKYNVHVWVEEYTIK